MCFYVIAESCFCGTTTNDIADNIQATFKFSILIPHNVAVAECFITFLRSVVPCR